MAGLLRVLVVQGRVNVGILGAEERLREELGPAQGSFSQVWVGSVSRLQALLVSCPTSSPAPICTQ